METAFDLRKYLVENRLTYNSKILQENSNEDSYKLKFLAAKKVVKDAIQLSSFNTPEEGISIEDMEQHILQSKKDKYIFWYYEPGEDTGTVEVSPEQALQIVKAMNREGDMPEGVPQGYNGVLFVIPGRKQDVSSMQKGSNLPQIFNTADIQLDKPVTVFSSTNPEDLPEIGVLRGHPIVTLGKKLLKSLEIKIQRYRDQDPNYQDEKLKAIYSSDIDQENTQLLGNRSKFKEYTQNLVCKVKISINEGRYKETYEIWQKDYNLKADITTFSVNETKLLFINKNINNGR